MKRILAIVLIICSLFSCLMLAGCGESYEEWNERQLEKGMSRARKQLGK